MHECVGGLTCEDFTAWCSREPPKAYPCLAEDERLMIECAGQ
jgi:hypothetical protein